MTIDSNNPYPNPNGQPPEGCAFRVKKSRIILPQSLIDSTNPVRILLV